MGPQDEGLWVILLNKGPAAGNGMWVVMVTGVDGQCAQGMSSSVLSRGTMSPPTMLMGSRKPRPCCEILHVRLLFLAQCWPLDIREDMAPNGVGVARGCSTPGVF